MPRLGSGRVTAESFANIQPHGLHTNTTRHRDCMRAIRTRTLEEISFVWESVREEITELSLEGEVAAPKEMRWKG